MSKRQQQQVEKRSAGFMGEFKKLLYRHQAWEVWRDFCTLAACSIANAVDKRHFETREKLYLDTIKRYNKTEQQVFPILFAETVLELERNPDQDFLGKMFMQLELGNHWKGQFFTPYNICHLMAQLNLDEQKENLERKGWISVCDCCCGAGAMLIAFANACRQEGINYQQDVLFVAQDIDPTAAYMCYIQLSLLGCPGYVKIGNALSEPLIAGEENQECVWCTPFYFTQVWNLRRMVERFQAMLPEEKPKEEQNVIIYLKQGKSQTSVILGGLSNMTELHKQMGQYGKETLEYCVGQKLLELCADGNTVELVEKDLTVKGMSLTDCAKKLQSYARNHQKGNFFYMNDEIAEKLICEFYGIERSPKTVCETEQKPEEVKEEKETSKTISFSLEDLL